MAKAAFRGRATLRGKHYFILSRNGAGSAGAAAAKRPGRGISIART